VVFWAISCHKYFISFCFCFFVFFFSLKEKKRKLCFVTLSKQVSLKVVRGGCLLVFFFRGGHIVVH